MTPVRLEPAALLSRIKHSTTEPLRSLWTEIGIRIYHELSKQDCLFWDATGSEVQKCNGANVLYYELVCIHLVKDQPAIPVVAMLNDSLS